MLYFNTILQIAELINSRQISPVELTLSLLERIDKFDPYLKSYATVTSELALEPAKKTETEIYRPLQRTIMVFQLLSRIFVIPRYSDNGRAVLMRTIF